MLFCVRVCVLPTPTHSPPPPTHYLQEVDQIKKALQKDEFRKLLAEYAKEISDPENRRIYEEEITRLERERGQDIKFLHPKVNNARDSMAWHASPSPFHCSASVEESVDSMA